MHAEQYMTREINRTITGAKCGKKACNCCLRGVAVCFWLVRLPRAFIKSTATRVSG